MQRENLRMQNMVRLGVFIYLSLSVHQLSTITQLTIRYAIQSHMAEILR